MRLFKRKKKDIGRVQGGAMALMLAICAVVTFWFVVGIVYREVTMPSGPVEVLEAAADPADYAYETQIVRKRKIEGATLTQGSTRFVSVDTKRGKFYATFSHVGPQPLRIAGDGKTVARSVGGVGSPWEVLKTNLTAADLRAPSPRDLRSMKPQIITDEADMAYRAWAIRFVPNARVLQRVLLSRAIGLKEVPGMDADLKQIAKGGYKVKTAIVWIARDDRQMTQMYLDFTVNTGAHYEALVKYRDFGQNKLKAFRLANDNF